MKLLCQCKVALWVNRYLSEQLQNMSAKPLAANFCERMKREMRLKWMNYRRILDDLYYTDPYLLKIYLEDQFSNQVDVQIDEFLSFELFHQRDHNNKKFYRHREPNFTLD